MCHHTKFRQNQPKGFGDIVIFRFQNGPRPGAIVWHYLRDPTFSRFDTIPECDRHRQTDTYNDGIYRA